jgi:hypothetical protein
MGSRRVPVAALALPPWLIAEQLPIPSCTTNDGLAQWWLVASSWRDF